MSVLDGRLLAKLMCPECLKIMSGPVMLCARGHSVCGDCRDARDTCAFCGNRFSDSRNFLAENIISNIFIQSYKDIIRNYLSAPAPEKPITNATKHPRPLYSCRVCGNLVDFSRLVSHFETIHPANVLKNGQSRTVRVREVNESLVYTFQLEHRSGIYWFWRRNEGATVRFGVQHVGGGMPGEAKAFLMNVVSPDRVMHMRFQAAVSGARDDHSQPGVVSAYLLGAGARFRVTVV